MAVELLLLLLAPSLHDFKYRLQHIKDSMRDLNYYCALLALDFRELL